MTKKIECVLLVDDSIPGNFLNKKILNETGKVNNIYEALNGLEALDFLKKEGKFGHITGHPNIIFLDINMPKMNGFEFLEEYSKLDKSLQADIIIIFLTTSNWGKDKLLAMENNFVKDFLQKPLDDDKFNQIYNRYFSEISI